MQTLFTDSGVGADATPPSADYTTLTGFDPLQRLADVILGTFAGHNNGCYVNSVADQGDCWIQGTMRGSTINSIGIMLRCATANANGYVLQFYSEAPQIARFDSGSYTMLVSDPTTYPQGTVIYFEAVGPILTAKANGVTILTYDTTPDGVQYASGRFGIYSFDTATGLDTITAGNFGDIKTVGGVAVADVKTYNGIAAASIKTINGVAF